MGNSQSSKEIPKVNIGDVAIKIGSGATPRGGKEAYKASGISLIRSMNVHDLKFNYSDLAFIDEEQAKLLDNVTVKRDDVLLNITGASVARCCMVPESILPARVNQHVAIIRLDKKKTNPYYLQYCLVSKGYKDHLISIAQGGATREALTKEKIESFRFPLPILSLQNKIAAILSTYDDLIENNLRRIKILEEMAQNLYREWFVNFRFPGHENTRFVDSPLGQIPEGWEIKELIDFGNITTGKTPSKSKPDYYGEGMPFIKLPDMHNSIYCIKTKDNLSKMGADTQKSKTIPPNSLCVSCIGTVGIVVITAYFSQTNQQINSIVLNKKEDLEFLYFALYELKQHIESYSATGATMNNLSRGKFISLKVLCPPRELIYSYHSLVTPLFKLILNLQLKNEGLSQTRDLLLPKLISGEVDVSELDIKVPEEVAI